MSAPRSPKTRCKSLIPGHRPGARLHSPLVAGKAMGPHIEPRASASGVFGRESRKYVAVFANARTSANGPLSLGENPGAEIAAAQTPDHNGPGLGVKLFRISVERGFSDHCGPETLRFMPS